MTTAGAVGAEMPPEKTFTLRGVGVCGEHGKQGEDLWLGSSWKEAWGCADRRWIGQAGTRWLGVGIGMDRSVVLVT